MERTFSSAKYQGEVTVPGSKSQTIRAYLIATFSRGICIVSNALESNDTNSCRKLCEQIGAKFTFNDNHTTVTIDASRVPRCLTKSLRVDCENSGTTLYLATGMLASLGCPVTITGDKQLRKRPVGALLEAFRGLGATILSEGGFPPFTIKGPLKGGSVSIECPTSQYLSGLLLSCPLALSKSEITVPLLYEKPYVGLTLGWLDEQHIHYQISSDWQHAIIEGKQGYKGFTSLVPGDYSSASFFFCLAAICKSTITVRGLVRDDAQGDRKILDILSQMGCMVSYQKNSVTITGPDTLEGGVFDLNAIPDALPALACTACFARGDVTFTNVGQARIKETDRIAVMHQELEKLGARITERDDGMTIHSGMRLHASAVEGHDDHRIIMALSIISAGIQGNTTIRGIDAAKVTFPTFFTLFDSLRGTQNENL